MMITVVCPNPCIDWQYEAPQFVYGGLNRVQHTRQDVGGKGINVCIALKNLGLDPVCTGFNFTENGDVLTKKLDNLDIRHDFVIAPGAVRTNIKLYDKHTGTMTELNQPGAAVPPEAVVQLQDKCAKTSGKNILVLSGSLPQNVSPDFYAGLIAHWPGHVFLDTDGEALRLALDIAPPFAIKPNLFELESTFGVKLNSPQEIAKFCQKAIPNVPIVCVSLGSEGAVLVAPTGWWFCPALNIEAKGVQGAGDAMVAGMIYALHNNLPEEQYLPAAMAAAAATISLDGTDMCTRAGFEKMLWQIPTTKKINWLAMPTS